MKYTKVKDFLKEFNVEEEVKPSLEELFEEMEVKKQEALLARKEYKELEDQAIKQEREVGMEGIGDFIKKIKESFAKNAEKKKEKKIWETKTIKAFKEHLEELDNKVHGHELPKEKEIPTKNMHIPDLALIDSHELEIIKGLEGLLAAYEKHPKPVNAFIIDECYPKLKVIISKNGETLSGLAKSYKEVRESKVLDFGKISKLYLTNANISMAEVPKNDFPEDAKETTSGDIFYRSKESFIGQCYLWDAMEKDDEGCVITSLYDYAAICSDNHPPSTSNIKVKVLSGIEIKSLIKSMISLIDKFYSIATPDPYKTIYEFNDHLDSLINKVELIEHCHNKKIAMPSGTGAYDKQEFEDASKLITHEMGKLESEHLYAYIFDDHLSEQFYNTIRSAYYYLNACVKNLD